MGEEANDLDSRGDEGLGRVSWTTASDPLPLETEFALEIEWGWIAGGRGGRGRQARIGE